MTSLNCRDERRRAAVRAGDHGLNGLDYVEVGEDQLTLTVFFLRKAPPDVSTANIRIDGGRRISGIRALEVRMCRSEDPEIDDCMIVRLDRFGDFSTYRLCLVEPDANGRPGKRPMASLDPRYACLDFSFKVDCPSDFDCAPGAECPPPAFDEPSLSYLAKDYASFRQLILDRMALVMPGWSERHEPDIGIALVELLAYTGDYLSYYQDAVATEAYLETARQRISVRRHVRLVDYQMHEGCNARAWVCVEADVDAKLPADVSFITGPAQIAGGRRELTWDELRATPAEQYEVFAPVERREHQIYAAHSRISFYTWGDGACCLPRGATAATLLDRSPAGRSPAVALDRGDRAQHTTPEQCQPAPPEEPARALHLAPGDILVFEEVLGPTTGDPADADPAHRHAVRLTSVTPDVDRLTGDPVLEIVWASADALPFPLCISATSLPPACQVLEDVSVARGNAILVDHGREVCDELLGAVPVVEELLPCEDAICGETARYTPGRFRPSLAERGLTFGRLPDPDAPARDRAAPPDPRGALPQIQALSIPLAPGGAATLFRPDDLAYPESLAGRLLDQEDPVAQTLRGRLSGSTRQLLGQHDPKGELSSGLRAALLADLRRLLLRWEARPDLLASDADDRHFTVEIDNDGVAHLRFGDGRLGHMPPANAIFLADYRVGNSLAGNVGADIIQRVVFGASVVRNAGLRPRNPLPARGGTAPESITDVKLLAPTMFHRTLERAVIADDYARLAERHPGVQRAAATLRWTGSMAEVHVAVDAAGGRAGEQLLDEVGRLLERYRRIGHTVVVDTAVYVPLFLALTVCVRQGYLRGHVEVVLRKILGSRRLPDGRLGMFHPDRLTFGQNIHVSAIVAAVQAVDGVERVKVMALQRLYDEPDRELDEGVLHLGSLEIAQLDSDPNYPEHGRLELRLEGGR